MFLRSLILSFTIISNAMAIIPSILNIPNQEEHTPFYLNRYWKWQNENVFNWDKYLTPLEAKAVKQLVDDQHRWISNKDLFEKESLLIGYHFQNINSKVSHSLSLSIVRPKRIAQLAKLYKIDDYSNLEFMIWRTLDNSLCFGHSDHKGVQTFQCYNRQSLQKSGTFFERNLPPESITDALFHDSIIKVREVVANDSKDLFYYMASSQFSLLPDDLKKFVVIHGTETRLPFDKIQLGANGDIAIFYP